MRTRRTNRIAVVLPELTGFVPTRTLGGAAAAAHDAGYLLDIVGLEGGPAARAERVRDLLQPENVDGILSFAPLPESTQGPTPSAVGVPVVVYGQYDDNMRSLPGFTEATPVADVIAHLVEMGHRRFVHVAGSDLWASARNRRTAYEAAVAELGLTSCAIVDGDWSMQSGWDAATTVIAKSGATAVLAANDRMAFGVVRGLQSLGIKVPADVSVFGWDDEEVGRYMDPTLSTVGIDQELQGREAVSRLLSLIRNEQTPPPLKPTILSHIILRESTGLAPK